MNLEKLEERLVNFFSYKPSTEGDKDEFDKFADDFARVFASQRLEVVGELGSMLARHIPAQWTYIRNSPRDDGSIRSYFTAIHDLAKAYPAAVVLEAENKEITQTNQTDSVSQKEAANVEE